MNQSIFQRGKVFVDDQIRRASRSVASNIGEAIEERYPKMFVQDGRC